MSHTPGPWIAGPDPNEKRFAHWQLLGGKDGLDYIANIRYWHESPKEAAANARLIAAAPELLEAAVRVAHLQSGSPAYAALRAVIAKAKGVIADTGASR